MKLHAVLHVKYICPGIGNLPALRQPGLHVQMRVAGEQVIEDQIVNAFGLRI